MTIIHDLPKFSNIKIILNLPTITFDQLKFSKNDPFESIYICSHGGAANIKFEEQVQIHKTIP